jgi:hypothetical protein
MPPRAIDLATSFVTEVLGQVAVAIQQVSAA